MTTEIGAPPDAPIARLGELLRRADDNTVLDQIFRREQSCAPLKLESALGDLDSFLRAGFLRQTRDGELESTLHYETYRGLLLASDRRETPYRPDHVLGVTGSGQLAGACIPPTAVGSALDMGTGCGILALLAARQAGQVIAMDVSPRAVAATSLNARLNDLDNVTAVCQSALDPIPQLFDLVVANPPFAVSPFNDYTYRDSGLPDDEASRLFLSAAASALAPDGIAVVLIEWLGHSFDRPKLWAAATGCAAWIVAYQTMAAQRYAELWAFVGNGSSGHAERARRWKDWLDAKGTTHVTSGIVVLHRSSRPTLNSSTSVPNVNRDLGAQLARGVRAQSSLTDGNRQVRLAPDVQLRLPDAVDTGLGPIDIDANETDLIRNLLSGAACSTAMEGTHRLLRAGALEFSAD